MLHKDVIGMSSYSCLYKNNPNNTLIYYIRFYINIQYISVIFVKYIQMFAGLLPLYL